MSGKRGRLSSLVGERWTRDCCLRIWGLWGCGIGLLFSPGFLLVLVFEKGRQMYDDGYVGFCGGFYDYAWCLGVFIAPSLHGLFEGVGLRVC